MSNNVVKLRQPVKPKSGDFSLEDVRLVESRGTAERAAPAPPAAIRQSPNPAPKTVEPFLHVPIRQIARGVKACGGQQLAVWLLILQKAKMQGPRNITLSNQALAQLGIGRKAKARALQQLEEAGLISVAGRERKSPSVTVLAAL